MSSQILLSGGDKWYSYSGVLFGDVSVPASMSIILIPSTGLRDSYVKIEPFYDSLVSGSAANSLGLEVKIDDTTVIKTRQYYATNDFANNKMFELFIPRQSKVEVLSLNTAGNNTQSRGCNLIGFYL